MKNNYKNSNVHLETELERANAIIESVADIIITLDLNGDIILVNNKGRELLGYIQSKIIGVNWFDVFLPSDVRQAEEDIFNNLISGDIEPAQYRESRILTGQGKIRTIAWYNTLLKNGDGEITALLYTGQDKTINGTSEERIRLVLDSSPFPIAMVDERDQVISFWSSSARELFGHVPRTPLEWSELAYPDPLYRQEVIERWKPSVEIARKSSEAIYTGEYKISCKDGSVITCEIYVYYISDHLIIYFNNITDRMSIENDLKAKQLLLNKMENIAKIGGWEMDLERDGKATWTKGTYDIVEIEFDQPIPGANEHINWYVPEHREMIRKKMQTLIDTRKPMQFEALVVTKSGHKKWTQAIGECVERDGKAVKLQGVFQDITERKLAELKLQEYQNNLEQIVEKRTHDLKLANEDLVDFAYSVSHDLKAPLRAITGFSQIILNRYYDNLNEEARQYFDYILTAGNDMNRLIEDLLKYSRLGRQSLRLQAIDLNKLFAGLNNLFGDRIDDLEGSISIPDNLPTIYSDETLLKQIFINLIENSISYHRKDVPPAINIDWKQYNNTICIAVTDNGIGIPAEFSEKVFKIFQRLHNNKDIPGTGVGLALVKKSVAMLNGNVDLISTVNEGSTFTIQLPFRKEKEKE